jgi:hypothetical protein
MANLKIALLLVNIEVFSHGSSVNQTRFRLSCACAVLIYLFEAASNAKDDWYEDIEYM